MHIDDDSPTNSCLQLAQRMKRERLGVPIIVSSNKKPEHIPNTYNRLARAGVSQFYTFPFVQDVMLQRCIELVARNRKAVGVWQVEDGRRQQRQLKLDIVAHNQGACVCVCTTYREWRQPTTLLHASTASARAHQPCHRLRLTSSRQLPRQTTGAAHNPTLLATS